MAVQAVASWMSQKPVLLQQAPALTVLTTTGKVPPTVVVARAETRM